MTNVTRLRHPLPLSQDINKVLTELDTSIAKAVPGDGQNVEMVIWLHQTIDLAIYMESADPFVEAPGVS